MVEVVHAASFSFIAKNILSLVFAVGLLLTLVQSGYEHIFCLHALRAYSLLVLVVEAAFRYVTPLAAPEVIGPHKGKAKKQSKVVELLWTVVVSLCSVVVTHTVTVLYGAYLIENIEETFTFSLLVASLAFIRPLITLGPSAVVALFDKLSCEGEIEVRSCAVVVAAWAGALPIPLDWDTPWQVWPLTCSIGAVLGELGASLFFLAKLWGKTGLQWKNKAK